MSGPASPMGISRRTIIGGDRHRPWNRPVTRPMGLPRSSCFDDRLQWGYFDWQLLQPLLPIMRRVKIPSRRASGCTAEHDPDI
jgi:hypothetical protein